MQKYPQAQGPACETLSNWFSSIGAEPIARQVNLLPEKIDVQKLIYRSVLFFLQAVQIELVPYLLGLLQSPSSVLSAAHKAHLVQALKALKNSQNPQLAEKVTALLDKSPGWAEYRDQKHDLFLGGPSEQNYLTGKGFEFHFASGFLIFTAEKIKNGVNLCRSV
jgi:hypothetical protein